MEEQPICWFDAIPSELTDMILSHVDPPSTVSIRKVCRYWFVRCAEKPSGCNVKEAAKRKYWDLIDWMLANKLVKNQHALCTYAAKYGNMKLFNQLFYGPYQPTGTRHAHNMEFIEMPNKDKIEFMIKISTGLVKSGNIELLEKLDDARCWLTNTPAVALLAAKKGWLHILSRPKVMSVLYCNTVASNVAHVAISNDQIHIIEWLMATLAHGAPRHHVLCARAAERGNLEMLKTLRRYGCSWDALTLINALENGHREIYTWAKNHGCEDNELSRELAGQ